MKTRKSLVTAVILVFPCEDAYIGPNGTKSYQTKSATIRLRTLFIAARIFFPPRLASLRTFLP